MLEDPENMHVLDCLLQKFFSLVRTRKSAVSFQITVRLFGATFNSSTVRLYITCSSCFNKSSPATSNSNLKKMCFF